MERRASIRSPTLLESAGDMVGAGRFERPTPCAQGRCATRLRYAPTLYLSDSKLLPRAMQRPLTSTVAKPCQNPRLGGNRGKIQKSAISVSCDRRQGKANSSKRSLVGQLEFCSSLTGAKLLIPLVVNHVMSTCFRGAQNPAERAGRGFRQPRDLPAAYRRSSA